MLTFSVENTFDGSTLPDGSDFTYPHTFDEPIPFSVKYSYKASRISDGKIQEYITEIHGFITGYPNASAKYPCLFVGIIDNSFGQFGGGVTFSGISGTQKRYLDGQQTASYNISSFNNDSTSWSTSVFSNFIVTIEECSIPLILKSYDDTLLYENEYYYLNQNTTGDTNAWAVRQVNAGYDIEKIYNAIPDDSPLVEYVYYGQAEQYIADEFGDVTMTDAQPVYRGFKVKSRKRCSLYEIAEISDGILKMGMNLQDVEIAYYSTDFGETWQQMAGQPTQIPFDFVYRNWHGEVGPFYALSVTGAPEQTNMYIFRTQEESDAYNDGEENEQDSINYPYVSPDNPPENDTGEPDDETVFGVVGTRTFFSQQYILSTGALSEIANALYDITQGGVTGIFEDIKKGCEMYGDSVIDDICGLYYFPFSASEVFTDVISQNYIYFGGYKFDMQNSVSKIIYPNGYKDFGSFTIETTFGDNIRSYEPYTKLWCYLAYIGWVQLDMKKYLHKTVSIRYYFDTRTGGCVACLLANGVLVDYYNGQIGVSMPMRATDYNAYANAQIQTLLGLNKQGGGGSLGNLASNFGQGLVESGGMSAGAVGVVGLGVGASVKATKTLYGLTQNNINNFSHTIGGSSSMINMFLPQECCFMFEVQDAMPTEYERELVGLPSNASGLVGSFNGYLECEQVNLVCSGATAKEQSEILRYLYNGVYI